MRRSLKAAGRDIRYAARILGRRPGFAAVAVVSLALGLGANLAIFQFVDAVVLKSLPGVRDPRQLAIVRGGRGFGYPWVRELARRADVFASVAAPWAVRPNLPS